MSAPRNAAAPMASGRSAESPKYSVEQQCTGRVGRTWLPQSSTDYAQSYRELAWSVIPTLGKRPHPQALKAARGTAAWASYRRTPASSDGLAARYGTYPTAGVAIVTDRPSGLVIVDVERGFEAPAAAVSVTTPCATSASGGQHFYFAAPRGDVPTRRIKEPGWGDLLGEGAYAVAPWRISSMDHIAV